MTTTVANSGIEQVDEHVDAMFRRRPDLDRSSSRSHPLKVRKYVLFQLTQKCIDIVSSARRTMICDEWRSHLAGELFDEFESLHVDLRRGDLHRGPTCKAAFSTPSAFSRRGRPGWIQKWNLLSAGNSWAEHWAASVQPGTATHFQ